MRQFATTEHLINHKWDACGSGDIPKSFFNYKKINTIFIELSKNLKSFAPKNVQKIGPKMFITRGVVKNFDIKPKG